MTPNDVRLVQQSFRKVAPVRDAVASAFYARLFEVDPTIRPMFASTDLRAQGNKLITMLAVVVHSLGDLDQIVPEVRSLGRRHVGYGVTAQHYDSVGVALLDTLAVGLGDDFTDEVRQAWTAAYGLLAGAMMSAAAEQAAAA
jgi:hemoglobin-like flavoprotein